MLVYTVSLFTFFAFRLADTPNGINGDEASYGYNGILLAHSLRDQNGRFLPFFILGSDGVTWYPPYLQYAVALSFKLFGPSIFALRLPNVIIAIFSAFLIFYLARMIFDLKGALIAFFAFLITPEVMIETHTALEHIIVVPFVLLWLICLLKYKLRSDYKYLVFAALSLGTGIYSYAGIRPQIAVWIVISIVYIAYLNWPKHSSFLKPLVIFVLTALPFFAIIPILEAHYPGAVFNHQRFQINSIYSFLYYYLASFDISFLFVTGDKLMVQSTGRHGMFLVTSLPLFLMGIYLSFRKRDDYFILLAITYLTSPFLFGFVGSAFFAHRLMYMIPFYSIFFTLGFLELLKNRQAYLKYFGFFIAILLFINFLDFWKYYMFDYPKDTYHIFYHLDDFNKVYREFYKQSKNRGLIPYISSDVAQLDGININDLELFSRAIYFPKLPSVLDDQNAQLPEKGILLSKQANLPNLKRLDLGGFIYNFYIKQ